MKQTPIEIKINVLKRGLKELQMYEQEVVDGENEVRASPDSKQTRQMLEESRTMFSHTLDRLDKANKDLTETIEKGSGEFTEVELEKAREILAQVQARLGRPA